VPLPLPPLLPLLLWSAPRPVPSAGDGATLLRRSSSGATTAGHASSSLGLDAGSLSLGVAAGQRLPTAAESLPTHAEYEWRGAVTKMGERMDATRLYGVAARVSRAGGRCWRRELPPLHDNQWLTARTAACHARSSCTEAARPRPNMLRAYMFLGTAWLKPGA
jgi:hypothetical protein